MRDGVQRSDDYRLELVSQDRGAAEPNESYRGRLAEGAAAGACRSPCGGRGARSAADCERRFAPARQRV